MGRRGRYVDGWYTFHLQNAARQPLSERRLELWRVQSNPNSGWWFADLIAQDRPHKMIRDFDLKRFERGLHIDERGAGSDPKLHG